MAEQVYYDLREQLDQYSVGFPSTESGVEIKLLQKLFTEEEALMFLNLSMMLEAPQSVADRIKEDPEKVTKILECMFDKGLIFRLRKGDAVQYGAVPFVVGSYEFQLKGMDREFADLMEQYFKEAFGKQGIGENPPLRTIPVGRAIQQSWSVAPYEDVRGIVSSQKRISVANCICRVQQGLSESGCDKPLEVCLIFGSHGDYYVDKGMARWIDQEEALRIVDRCDEAGLVPQPFNAQNPGGLCNCCGDCCGILRSIKLHPKPAEKVITNYYAEVDAETCSGCEICLERCQMDAISMNSEQAAIIDRDRCIGCGLCVTTCSTGAMSLMTKPSEERREPPATPRDMIMETAQKRGKTLIPLALMKG